LLSVFVRHTFLPPSTDFVPPSVAALRALIEQRFPDATPVTHRITERVATGIDELDRVLPNGGLPRGHLSVWAPRGGSTALLRATCDATLARGERATWIDAQQTIAGAFWTAESPLLVRPQSRVHALRAAEELLRCGGFALVVLSGVEPHGTENVRLTRAAREGGTALVSLTTSASVASLRLTSRLTHYEWRRSAFGDPAEVDQATVRVTARAAGWSAHTEFALEVKHHELRLSLESELADRRGLRR